MSKKKVIFLVPTLNKGGAERVVSILSNYLSDKFNTTIVTFSSEMPQFDIKAHHVSLEAGAYKNILMKIFNVFVRVFKLRQFIKKNRPDLMISFMESSNIPAILATRFLNWNNYLIVSVRNNPSMFPWYYRFLIKLLYRLSDKIVSPSFGIYEELKKYIQDSNRIKFIPNPIDYEIIKRQSLQESDLLTRLPGKYILGVGRLTYQKGFDRLISIFSKVQNEEIGLVILGEGELRQELNSLAQGYGLEKNFFMPGVVDNPFPIFKSATCLALTSRYEGWPNVINESIASSCPVISYNCKYGPNEILDFDNAFLIEEEDEDRFVEAISILDEDNEKRERYIKAGLKNIDKYSVNRIATLWLEKTGLKL